MAQLNAAAVAAKWASRMANAGEEVKRGVQAVTQNPAELAAQAKDRWIAGIQRAAAEGRFEQGLSTVTLSGWQQKTINKGIPNMLTGAREAQGDVQKVMSMLLPACAEVSAKCKSMPRGTIADSVARATMAIQMMAARKGTFKA